jgi:hypothetical protein
MILPDAVIALPNRGATIVVVPSGCGTKFGILTPPMGIQLLPADTAVETPAARRVVVTVKPERYFLITLCTPV